MEGVRRGDGKVCEGRNRERRAAGWVSREKGTTNEWDARVGDSGLTGRGLVGLQWKGNFGKAWLRKDGQ